MLHAGIRVLFDFIQLDGLNLLTTAADLLQDAPYGSASIHREKEG